MTPPRPSLQHHPPPQAAFPQAMAVPLQALVLGMDSMAFAPARVLRRAGFDLDRLGPRMGRRHPSLFRRHHVAQDVGELLAGVLPVLESTPYDLVVVSDDATLRLIAQSDLPESAKQRLLPVVGAPHRAHLHSKIQLSLVLHAAGIRTPAFRIATDPDTLALHARDLGFPLLLKQDSSSGGRGVIPCRSTREVLEHTRGKAFPLLLQQWIDGDVIDLSGFYKHGRLVHFNHARMEEFLDGPFGPSSVRTYTQLGALPGDFFQELSALGNALGAHGFCNTTCIQSASDGHRYYIEADLRPNLWTGHDRFVGHDMAAAIRGCFRDGSPMPWPQPLNPAFPVRRIVPHPARVSAWDLVCNRHRVRSFIEDDTRLVHHLAEQPARWMAAAFKRLRGWIPETTYLQLRQWYGRHRHFR